MTIYLLGPSKLALQHFNYSQVVIRLRLRHILKLSSTDVIITARPWSLLLEGILFWKKYRRPRIIQVADGLAFPLNATKFINQRYGGLQRNIFADTFIALQNKNDFDLITNTPKLIYSNTIIETQKIHKEVNCKTALLVAGNDPFFDFNPNDVCDAFERSAKQMLSLGIKNILLSCPNRKLKKNLLKRLPNIQEVGRLIDFKEDTSHFLMIGSPSTVMLDHMQKGGVSLLIDFYTDPVLSRYFSPAKTVLEKSSHTSEGLLNLHCLSVTNHIVKPINLDDLLASLPHRDNIGLRRRAFFSALRIRLLVRELHLLLGGH